MAGLIEQLDAQLEQLFASWNLWSTLLVLVFLTVLGWPLLTYKEPDTHPLLLSRQANVGMVRQPGESAVYRSLEVPHGLPLRTGLNVKDKGQSKWSMGKDGDVRDVWRRFVAGSVSDDANATGARGSIKTVYGRQDIETHDAADLSKQINTIGRYIKNQGGTTVAIYLPNSIELLLTVFAAAFYGFHPILVPYGIPQDVVLKLVGISQADFLIAEAGTVPLDNVKSQCKNIKQTMWVVEKTSRHMDWTHDIGGLTTSAWHEIIQHHKTTETEELLPNADGEKIPDIVTIWQNKSATSGEIVSFSQANIVAAVAAQVSAIPTRHRFTHEDLFLPADSLTQPYMLVQTLAALYAGTHLALNSVAGSQVDLATAAAGVAPTIMAASAVSVMKLYEETKSTITSGIKKSALSLQKQALQAGYMPPTTVISRINEPTKVTLGTVPSKLRLLYIFERVNASTPALSPEALSEIRALTGARVIYSLTAAKIAGNVTQTGFYDYRTDKKEGQDKQSHFGAPLSSLEVKLVDTDSHKTVEGQNPMGEVSNSQLTKQALHLLTCPDNGYWPSSCWR